MMEKFRENLGIFYENYKKIKKIIIFGLFINLTSKKKLEFLIY